MNRYKFTSAHSLAVVALVSAMSFTGAALAAESNAAAVKTAAATKPAVDRDEETQVKQLHDQLKITPEQESLWANVAQIMRSNDAKIDTLVKERHDKASTMTAVEDLRSYGAITEAHAVDIKTFIPAFERLYESMSPAQKANADNIFRTGGHKAVKKAS
jgi:periplasmic protein CpxP/Spy